MHIRAAVLREKGAPLVIEDVEMEDPRDDEVMVKVSHVGVCHTDISIQNQVFPTPLPVVLGHEGSGYVAKMGKSVRGFKEGDPVIMCYDSCGQCKFCRSGYPTYCELVTPLSFGCKRLDGTSPLRKGQEIIWGNFFGQSSFATYAMATTRNLVKLESDKGLEYFGPLGCGFNTGAGAVINALKVGMGEDVAVFGIGSVGLCGIMAANLIGAGKIIAVDIVPEKLKLAQELGATHIINSKETPNISQAIRDIVGPMGIQHIFDSTGIPALLRQGVEALTHMGRCATVGMSSLDTEISLNLMNLMTVGKHFMGVVEGNSVGQIFLPQLVGQFLKGKFPIDRLVTFYDFEKINEAIEDLHHGKVIKGILKIS